MPGESILIVEDDEAIRETLDFALSNRAYDVRTAENGIEALAILRTLSKPCLVLLDLMMPVLDGWGFAKAIAADDQLKNSPVVVVTATSGKVRSIKCKQVIRKPIDLNQLYELVHRLCTQQKKKGVRA